MQTISLFNQPYFLNQLQEPMKTEEKHTTINYISSSSNLPCNKHPYNPSLIGICAYCLKEKLINLICSYCGENRISSCSCSELPSYRNSYSTVDIGSIGSVGIMSFLIENDKGISNDNDPKSIFSNMLKQRIQGKTEETEDIVLLKRSNSCVLEVKKNKGFWKIGNLFKKKREKEDFSERNTEVMDVLRSRSFSSFMDDSMLCSSGKMSDFHELELRKSRLMEFEKGFVIKESNFSIMDDDNVNDDDDDEFIDLKIDLFDKLKTENSVFKKCDPLDLMICEGMGLSSCRFVVNERGIKKVKKSQMKVLKWICKHHSGKKEINHILKS